MISAAKGAETFYTLENHSSRSEDLETARMLDTKAAEAWVGHPNVDSVRQKNKKYICNVQLFGVTVNHKVDVICFPFLIDRKYWLQFPTQNKCSHI